MASAAHATNGAQTQVGGPRWLGVPVSVVVPVLTALASIVGGYLAGQTSAYKVTTEAKVQYSKLAAEANVQYVKLAAGILGDQSSNNALRKWAWDMLDAHSSVTRSAAEKEKIEKGLSRLNAPFSDPVWNIKTFEQVTGVTGWTYPDGQKFQPVLVDFFKGADLKPVDFLAVGREYYTGRGVPKGKRKQDHVTTPLGAPSKGLQAQNGDVKGGVQAQLSTANATSEELRAKLKRLQDQMETVHAQMAAPKRIRRSIASTVDEDKAKLVASDSKLKATQPKKP